ncbi:hypothetical protein [Chitinophaga sancti]|uniref:Oxygen tolerance n=1 Tax=Chitinophaga sancti TaxID=1004 RepID=A0A1K1NTV3_9BACT|nr:hypothetical protein [Chitinophaga sancti]WQD60175.1 hypothetical protein U0033_19995 [Chitinophaga sancti]WQG87697.1 hypothetical protein SR876_22475 [Chitinophaga sancti]SFW38705.1 hypothetical protein SAMN05661012_01470 [Chitinophaga sancti]
MGKQIIVKTLILFAMLGTGLASQAQVQVSARTDTNRIRIGEQVKLILSATVPDKGAGNVVFPQLPDSFTHWEVVSRTGFDTSAANGNKVFQQTLVLTSFDSGSWNLPALKFDVISNGAVADSAFTDSLLVDVGTVAVDTTKAFKPIKAVRSVPWSFWDYWLYFAIGISGIIIGIGLFVYFRSRPKKVVVKPTAPAVPPYEVALLALRQLKEEKLWQQGDVKQYYTRITDILRAYFEQQFNIPALEQTSEELLQHIKPVTILNQQRDRLRDLLTIADLAKFAKLTPTPEEHERALSQAFEIVEWTKPAVEKAKEGNDAGKTEGAGS